MENLEREDNGHLPDQLDLHSFKLGNELIALFDPSYQAKEDLVGLVRKMICVYDEAFVLVDAVDEIGQDRTIVSGSSQKPS